jgi:tetraspanin-11
MGYGQEMDGCGQCMKYSMFIANFIIFVGGITVLGIGIWTLVDKAFMNELLGTNLFLGAVYILIATGAIISLIAFFGCLGALKEIKCMLLTYFMIVFLIFVTMLVGGILGYVFREKVHTTMEQEMRSTVRLYTTNRAVKRAWDDTQERLKCCGVTSYEDWKTKIPESCCRIHSEYSSFGSCLDLPGNIFTLGCLDITEKFVKDHAAIIGGAGIGVACLMLLGMIFSCALFKMIE